MKYFNCLRAPETLVRSLFVIFLVLSCSVAFAGKKMKPYILASSAKLELNKVIQNTRNSLSKAGFTIIGSYTPYKNAHVIVVTNQALKNNAAQTKLGGFGGAQRISITKQGDTVQVAYTNPEYMANIYRMKGTLSAVTGKLKEALGGIREFGVSTGLTAKSLRKYHYKIFMPYFNEPITLGKFSSYQQAMQSVEDGLKQKRGGVSKVYRLDLGNNKTLIGVRMTEKCSGDNYIMSRIDKKSPRSTPHLPYEILVLNNKVIALHARFRIAQSFPGLSMVGRNSFFSIMCAPGAIQKALTKMTGKK